MADTARRFVLASLSASHSHSSFWSSSSSSSSSIGPSASDYYDVRDLQEEDDVDGGGDVVAGTTGDLGGMILLIGSSTLIALLLSSGALGFMIRHAESLIKTALLFNVVCTAVVRVGAGGTHHRRLCRLWGVVCVFGDAFVHFVIVII
jgi:hypothetical protein